MHDDITIACPRCGSPIGRHDRIHRREWQWLLFPHSRRYQCPKCERKVFITNIDKYRQRQARKAADAAQRRVRPA